MGSRERSGGPSHGLAERNFLLDAAALQDRLTRSVGLGQGRRTRPARRKLATARATGGARETLDALDGEMERGRRGELTFAQLRGLEERPERALTTGEWQEVEREAAHRLLAARTADCCAICQEVFGPDEQVLLNCSHMFHAACLAAFERFTRCRHKDRTCPVCRKRDYQKKLTSAGAVRWRFDAATKLAARYRGYAARKWFAERLREYYSSGGGDAARRRLFFSKRVASVVDRVARVFEEEEDALAALFAEVDRSLQHSRQIMSRGIVAQRRTSPGAAAESRGAGASTGAGRSAFLATWGSALSRARARCDRECPICLGAMRGLDGVDADGVLRSGTGGGTRALTLLSCGHVFHDGCVAAFEAFNVYEGVLLCPLCRQSYSRVTLREPEAARARSHAAVRRTKEGHERTVGSGEANV